MPFSVEDDIAPDPIDVRFFRPFRIMRDAKPVADQMATSERAGSPVGPNLRLPQVSVLAILVAVPEEIDCGLQPNPR
jgi:hypothetical protein